ncbi:MAG: hypothetical protein KDD25_08185, partial [Bdellovibrionales bacterium]|nr:hypothetical protein [Bdellovibrionales bacterium]
AEAATMDDALRRPENLMEFLNASAEQQEVVLGTQDSEFCQRISNMVQEITEVKVAAPPMCTKNSFGKITARLEVENKTENGRQLALNIVESDRGVSLSSFVQGSDNGGRGVGFNSSYDKKGELVAQTNPFNLSPEAQDQFQNFTVARNLYTKMALAFCDCELNPSKSGCEKRTSDIWKPGATQPSKGKRN